MQVRMVQTLILNGETFQAGEVADLPSPTAIACLRRGTAQRANAPAENRVVSPPEQQVEGPPENRVEGPPEDQAEGPPENRQPWWRFGRRRRSNR